MAVNNPRRVFKTAVTQVYMQPVVYLKLSRSDVSIMFSGAKCQFCCSLERLIPVFEGLVGRVGVGAGGLMCIIILRNMVFLYGELLFVGGAYERNNEMENDCQQDFYHVLWC